MFELLLLMCVAYAGARGVESLAGTANRQYKDKAAEKTVVDLAKSAGKGGKPAPGPTDKGGTFSNAAPRSSAFGGKAAVPLAVAAETGATMWGAVLEGYRNRWPEIRTERRQQMEERAEKRKAEKDATEADKPAKDAADKAEAPESTEVPADAEKEDPAPAAAKTDEALAEAEARIEAAERKAEDARKDAEDARAEAAADKVLAAQKEAREAKEREAAAEERTRLAEERNAAPNGTTSRPHLALVTSTDGADMSTRDPYALIPEIRTLDGLLNALALIKAMCEMRAEEGDVVAADDRAIANRFDEIAGYLASDERQVDPATIAELEQLRETFSLQADAAAKYGTTAQDSAAFSAAAAGAAHKSHGLRAEAIQSSPIEKAATAGYYER